MAHDLNQPLTATLNNLHVVLDLLSQPGPDLDEVRSILTDVAADSRRARDLIARLRGWIKDSDTQFSPHSLNALVEETVQFLKPEFVFREIDCTLDLCPDLPAISCQKLEVQQVIANLLCNAMDSHPGSPPGGRVIVHTSREGERHVRLTVRDHGTGIADDVLSNLFQPFVTTKRGGLGIGLSICRRIIEDHAGEIGAENHPEGGALFHFTLPVAPP